LYLESFNPLTAVDLRDRGGEGGNQVESSLDILELQGTSATKKRSHFCLLRREGPTPKNTLGGGGVRDKKKKKKKRLSASASAKRKDKERTSVDPEPSMLFKGEKD